MFHREPSCAEELPQRARPLGELHRHPHLVAHRRRPSAHHVPDVRLGEVVLAQVDARIAARGQLARDGARAVAARHLDPDEDVRLGARRQAVVELGDAAVAERLAEREEGPRPLGDGDREDRLAVLAHLGALDDVAEAGEVHVGARRDRDDRARARRRRRAPRASSPPARARPPAPSTDRVSSKPSLMAAQISSTPTVRQPSR